MTRTRVTVLLLLVMLTPCLHGVENLEKKLKPLADLLENKHFAAAVEWCNRRRPAMRFHGYRMVADYYLFWDQPAKAADYYDKAGYSKGFNRIGTYFMRQEDPETARRMFNRGTASRERIRFFLKEAKRREKAGDSEGARSDYEFAREDLITLIGSLGFEFTADDAATRRSIQEALDRLPRKEREAKARKRLKVILRRTGEYCRQLHERVFYFYCIEEIEEKIDRLWEVGNPTGRRRLLDGVKLPSRQMKRSLRFDYQLVREEGEAKHTESRTLLRENGIPRKVLNARNKSIFQVSQPVFAPIEFLAPQWQDMYWFRIIENTRWRGRPVVIIQAVPYDPGNMRIVSGRIWIDRKDGSVLRIQMAPKSIRNHHQILKEANRRGLTPALTFDIQFLQSNGGFRFPTHCILEERYTAPQSAPFVRVHTEYRYRKYRFFQVSSRVSAPMVSEPPL